MTILKRGAIHGATVIIVYFCTILSSYVVDSQSIGCFSPAAMHCNGMPNLCDIQVNKVMFGMVHNAMSSTDAGFIFYANHRNDPFNAAFDAGYRAVKLDLCNCEDQLMFCHGGRNVGCGIGSRDPVATLSKLNDWLNKNPHEVVVIYLSLNEAAEGPISLEDVDSLVQAVPNQFGDKLYNHEVGEVWPSLRELIENNNRIILFYVDGPEGSETPPRGIHYFYDYGMETESMFENVRNLQDGIKNGCKVVGGSESSRDFLLFNNYVTGNSPFGQFIPSQSSAKKVNSLNVARSLCQACEETHNAPMNLISVDFWNSGNIPELVQQHNKMLLAPGATRCPTAMPSSSPSLTPTQVPSSMPSIEPTSSPTEFPTRSPSSVPSNIPTVAPTSEPSRTPTSGPSELPTSSPTITARPTFDPARAITVEPTFAGNYSIQQTARLKKEPSRDGQSPSANRVAKLFSVLLKVMFIVSGLVGLVSS